MVGKDDKPTFHTSRRITASTFLLIGIIISNGTLFAFPLVLDQNHTAMAQQGQTSTNATNMNIVLVHGTG